MCKKMKGQTKSPLNMKADNSQFLPGQDVCDIGAYLFSREFQVTRHLAGLHRLRLSSIQAHDGKWACRAGAEIEECYNDWNPSSHIIRTQTSTRYSRRRNLTNNTQNLCAR